MIKDSGERKQFESGAVRDIQKGKGRCDLLPLDVVAELLCDKVLEDISLFMISSDAVHLENAFFEFSRCEYEQITTAILEVSKHYEEGAEKYGEHNWEKGIPLHCYIDSAIRHYLKHKRGDDDEPHNRAFLWNILGALWTLRHWPVLNDLQVKMGGEDENS